MAKQETHLQFDLYSLSDKFPVTRSLAAVALVAALLAPTGAETGNDALILAAPSLAIEQE